MRVYQNWNKMEFNSKSHRRYNILTGEWILVSPHRTKRPWQGKRDITKATEEIVHDPHCYLCPGNTRASGDQNPNYEDTFSFQNDFAALIENQEPEVFQDGLLRAESEEGICKVVCFSPNHSLTLPLMEVSAIKKVVDLWQREYLELGAKKDINHVQIFENKGAIMGCSNPHPHGQIWAQKSIPEIVLKKQEQQRSYFATHQQSLLSAYITQERALAQRILFKNDHFVALVPYWAVWPYETMIIPLKHYQHIGQLNEEEKMAFADIIKKMTTAFDNLFKISFPYSAGIHQSPTDKEHPEWHFHLSFYPPLLRSAEVKKFMVGYEMFANPQRDITAEQAATALKELPLIHFSKT